MDLPRSRQRDEGTVHFAAQQIKSGRLRWRMGGGLEEIKNFVETRK
jgi:hypothetical protein